MPWLREQRVDSFELSIELDYLLQHTGRPIDNQSFGSFILKLLDYPDINTIFAKTPDGPTYILWKKNTPDKIYRINKTTAAAYDKEKIRLYFGDWVDELPPMMGAVLEQARTLQFEESPNAEKISIEDGLRGMFNKTDIVKGLRRQKNYRYIVLSKQKGFLTCAYCGKERYIENFYEPVFYCSTTFPDGTEGVLGVMLRIPCCSDCIGFHNEAATEPETVYPYRLKKLYKTPIIGRSLAKKMFYTSYETGIKKKIQDWLLDGFSLDYIGGRWELGACEPYMEMFELGLDAVETRGDGSKAWAYRDYAEITEQIKQIAVRHDYEVYGVYETEVDSWREFTEDNAKPADTDNVLAQKEIIESVDYKTEYNLNDYTAGPEDTGNESEENTENEGCISKIISIVVSIIVYTLISVIINWLG